MRRVLLLVLHKQILKTVSIVFPELGGYKVSIHTCSNEVFLC